MAAQPGWRLLAAASLAATVLAFAGGPSDASASTIQFISSQNRIYYIADPGETISVVISAEGDKNTGNYVFQDSSATITDADGPGGCSVVDSHTATCSKVGVLIISAAGQGGDDHITANLNPSEVPDHPQDPVHTILRGNDGNDTIVGSALRDDIFGGNGNDTIDSGGGPDQVVDGGAGNDTISFASRPASDDVFAELRGGVTSTGDFRRHAVESDGSTIKLLDNFENIVGGAGNDTLIGDFNDNTLVGGPGANVLCGGLGNDTVDYSGSPGPVNVSLDGNPNMTTDPRIVNIQSPPKARQDCRAVDFNTGDSINNKSDPRYMVDCTPNDGMVVNGVSQGDCVGNDVENVIGSRFNDVLVGNDPSPLFGGSPLVEPSGINHLMGGPGDDVLDGGLGADVLDGGPGNNTVTYASRSEAVRADLGGDAHSGSSQDVDPITGRGDQLINIQNVIGGSGNDLLIGSPGGHNGLFGGPGDDTLIGGGKGDTLAGGPGNDTLKGGPGGQSKLDGGDGNDLLVPARGGQNTVVGGGGSDTVDYSSRTNDVYVNADGIAHSGEAGEGDTVMPDVENIIGGSGNNTLVGGPNAGSLFGGPGDDTLVGGPGGHDLLAGGEGNDRLVPGRGGGTTVSGGGGFDTVSYAGRTAPVKVTLDGVADSGEAGEVDRIMPDVESATGGTGNDILIGNAAGGGRLDGGPGNDIVDGGLGSGNTLYGGPGNDILKPGRGGHNLVIGGGGNDTVDYSSRTKDVFVDLNGGHDSGEKGDQDSIATDIATVKTGSGNDTIDAVNGRADSIFCGRGIDTVFADQIDQVAADCENVTRGGVSVSASSSRCAISGRSVTMTARGVVGVRIKCPFNASGTLTLETAHAVRSSARSKHLKRLRLGRKKFRISRAGRATIVRVKLSGKGRRLVRRQKHVRANGTAVIRQSGVVGKAARTKLTRAITIKAPHRKRSG